MADPCYVGGRPGETHQRKRRQGAPGRPNLAEGKTRKEALRCLKRQISDVIFACPQAGAARAAAVAAASGRPWDPLQYSPPQRSSVHWLSARRRAQVKRSAQ